MSQTPYILSAVLIADEDTRGPANAIAVALDKGPCLNIALSATGAAPATHWACQSYEKAEFQDFFENVPQDAPAGTAAIIATMRQNNWISVETRGDGDAHFKEVIEGLGLQILTDSSP